MVCSSPPVVPGITPGGVATALPPLLLKHYESSGNLHVREGTPVNDYVTRPPTSGRHWPQAAAWGISSTPVPDERAVHNLEHGGVVISYRGLTAAELDRLRKLVTELARTHPKLLVRPYDQMERGRVAVTAWQWLMLLDQVNEAEIGAFVTTHYEGPEAPEAKTR